VCRICADFCKEKDEKDVVMKVKPTTHYWIDLCAFLCFVIAAVSGIILGFFLPHGGPRGGFHMFFFLTKYSWKTLHKWCGLLFISLILIHLIVHWRWVLHMTKKIFRKNSNPQNKNILKE